MFALVIGIIEDKDWGIRVTIDIFGKVARFFASREDMSKVVFGGRTINDTKTDDAGKGSNNNCNDDTSFFIHGDIITNN